MIWRNGLNEEGTHCGMDALEKWMIIRFTPHQTTTLPKWTFLLNFSPNHPCCSMACAAFKYFPQTAATTFAFPSVWFLFYLLTSAADRQGSSSLSTSSSFKPNRKITKVSFYYLIFNLYCANTFLSEQYSQQTFYHKCPVGLFYSLRFDSLSLLVIATIFNFIFYKTAFN